MEYESFHEEAQDEISKISHESILEESEDILLEESEDILEEPEDILEEPEDIVEEPEDILEEPEDILEESESILEKPETRTEFPNEAYADLMILVTRHKLNNKASNAIIKFFNKHSNLTTSPLPKNIERGREFMNNMTFVDLKFKKTCITSYNDNEYFLYHRNLISCIKNILAIPDITQDFALSFSNYMVFFYDYHIILYFNKIMNFTLFHSVMEKVFTKNKIPECGGRQLKIPCPLVLNYYHLFYIRMQQQQTR